ncbi:MFS transporter [Streptomyces laculatispora]|uniref:MFS transporter n=1 Tax=Streptomyces laculatispora TaxID=887464 RepID=UPI001F5F1BDE|nr:MFS transporter [Streptomyces laculatispora]
MSQDVDGAASKGDEPSAPPAPEGAEPGESVFSGPHRALTLGVLLSVSMVAFESLGVATVLPGIARNLEGLGAYGWGLSALMLANIIGTVTAGRAADRSGPWRPMAVGTLVFAAGCAVAGVAANWPLFLLGRFCQGLGIGAVVSMAYTVVGLAYPGRLRARMFALLSSAWTIPSLIGPVIASGLTELTSWRGVFLLMLPLIAIAAILTLPALRKLDHTHQAAAPGPAQPWWRGPLAASVLLTAGTALLLQALLLKNLVLLVVLGAVGAVIAVLTLRQVTPEGTLSLRPGLGAGIGIRFLLCAVYFGSEAFLPLGLQDLRQVSVTEAGLGLSAGAITWVVGSTVQAKRDGKGAEGRGSGVMLGFAILFVGVLVMALGVLSESVPALTAVAGWAIGGIGMGIAFNASTTETMEQAPAERQGEVSGALQLSQTLATAVVAGLGGAAIAIAHDHDGSTRTALSCTFLLTAALALVGTLVSRRLRPAACAV